MDNKAIIGNVATAVITAAVLGVLGFFMGIFERGAAAINEDQIELVVRQIMVTDAGKTYAARLAELDGEIIGLETRVEIVSEDVNELEVAIRTLAQ